MAFTIDEKWESGDGQSGLSSNTDKVIYHVRGDPDPDTDNADDGPTVQAWARGNIDPTYNGRPLANLERTRLGGGAWLITASYETGSFTPTGEKTFTFSTVGGSQHITVAKHHTATYFRDSVVTDGVLLTSPTAYDGFINPSTEGVAGTDIPIGDFGFSITRYIAPEDMTSDYVALLYLLSDTVNATTFTADFEDFTLTFAEGECRFNGATGAKRGYGDYEVTLNFNASPNVTGIAFAGFTSVDKKGFEYISVVSEVGTDSADPAGGGTTKFVAPVAKFALVDRVFDEDNWTGLVPS